RKVEADRYERVSFERSRLRLDLTDLLFERRDPREGYRSDRTMRTSAMRLFVDSLEQAIARERATIADDVARMLDPASTPTADRAASGTLAALANVNRSAAADDSMAVDETYAMALRSARAQRARLDDTRRNIRWEQQHVDQYRVELHKKTSIAVACIIFILLGIPLGLSVRRHGFGRGGAVAVGIFLFYWVTLVEGEKLADRGLLPPWLGMWFANAVMLLVALIM